MKKRDFWKNEKVSLRIVEKQDADPFYLALSNYALRRQLEGSISLPVTVEDGDDIVLFATELTEQIQEIWLTVLDKEDNMVGYVVLGCMNEKDGVAQCDVVILPEYRKLGYGKSTLELLLKYAFMEKRFHKIHCVVVEENREGQIFLEKNGFTLEAIRKEVLYGKGKYQDKYYYGITEDEYKNLSSVNEKGLKSKEDLERKVFPNLPKTLTDDRPNFWVYENLIVKLMDEDDYFQNSEMLHSEEDMQFYNNEVQLPKPYDQLTDREQKQILFQEVEGRIEFAVRNMEDEYLGNINLCDIDEKNGTFSMSLYFLPKARKNGYATKAMALVLYYAFMERRLHKLNICVNEGNKDSENLMYRLGCEFEGKMRENLYYGGRYVDVRFFGLTKEKFAFLLENDG